MTDINTVITRSPNGAGDPPATDGDVLEIVELLFFAYRDFISDPDKLLAEYGFGRAHHRVLHFLKRNPGIRVADLLDILKITKQSLGRVLKQLIDEEFVYQVEGQSDRRQRLLHLTDRGSELAESLARPQIARVRAALERAGPDAHDCLAKALFNLVDDGERATVHRLVRRD